MSFTAIILIAFLIAFIGKFAWDKIRATPSPLPVPDEQAPETTSLQTPTAEAPTADTSMARVPILDAPIHYQLYDIGSRLIDFFNTVAHPGELVPYPIFQEGVAYLCSPTVSRNDVIGYALGEHVPISCMALEAMRLRTDTTDEWRQILSAVGTMAPFQHYFAFEYLAYAVPDDEVLIGPVLGSTTYCQSHRVTRKGLENLIRHRSRNGEVLELAEPDITFLNNEGLGVLSVFLASLDPTLGKPLLSSLEKLRPRNPPREPTADSPDQEAAHGTDHAKEQRDLLKTVGRVWQRKDADNAAQLIRTSEIDAAVADIEALLTADHAQSILLVGDDGVGKTSLLSILGQKLFNNGWIIFVAGHNDIQAGQIWIGQVEQRLKQLIARLQKSSRLIWYVPSFDQLVFTGTHMYSSSSAMDAILPHIANGSLRIIAEISPTAYQQLIQRQPRIASTMAIRTVDPASREATLDIAAQWLANAGQESRTGFLTEVWDLAQQYLTDRASPGNVLDLLKATYLRSASRGESGVRAVTLDAVIETLASQSGMPMEILDQKRGLDLDDLRRSLAARVIGQDEAIDCLVDRVAMLKAAVLDPMRPLGVFLFAGPTGTGKTEIAKSLAAWLFGSADRLIRIDMSELQDVQGLDRLIGNVENARTESLADQVRRQPFSVVLLDEFEKAHPNTWDLFLQIFDDARITDRRGQTTYFRNAIIILTVNLGATIPTRGAIGFATRGGGFDEHDVQAAIEKVFRREFVNRLDRVVVFRPLDREVMRQILHRELEKAFDRRGLKGRPWAVEWDESAIGFLLEKGFTPDLGARPLRRAIEQHLLAPLADTIVRHRFPEGDQFLFISRRGNNLRVEFVDPDLEEKEATARAVAVDDGESGTAGIAAEGLRTIVLQPIGDKAELAALSRSLDELRETIQSDAWLSRKQSLFAEMETPDFWNGSARHSVLGTLEIVDRIEKSFERAEGLQRRLEGLASRQRPPSRLISILAQSLYLLSVASRDIEEGAPQDAFLVVDARAVVSSDADKHIQFAHRIADMYESWSDKRNMRLACLLRTSPRDANKMRTIYSVSGYGAYSILSPETGLHVLETTGDAPNAQKRLPVRVTVAPQPDGPLPPDPGDAVRLAEQALENNDEPNPKVVRRYREAPSPLVRDNNRGWRTGRIDLVLGGDFDLL